MSRRRAERGQILVIFTGGIVLLLAIGALVIDLGFVFMIRRQEQNAADPGAIAAARYIKAGGGVTAMRNAACFYAHQNGFFGGPSSAAACDPANDPNGSTLTVNFPPSSSAGTFAGRPDMVEVIVSRNHESFLGGVLGIGQIGVSSGAVAAFSDGPSNTSSLIALDPSNSCSTGRVHGTGNVTIHPLVPGADGGYIHVNSTCGGTADGLCGSSSQGGLDLAGTGDVSAPHTYVSGTCKSNGDQPGPLTEGAVQIGDPLVELPPPEIADYPAGRCGVGGAISSPTSGGCDFSGTGTVHLEPGVYYGTSSDPAWDVKNTVALELGPGVYILAGGGIKLSTGGTITSVQGTSGSPVPVLIFNTDNPATKTGQANIDLNGGSLKLRAIDTGPYKGIVVWNDGNGSNPSAIIDLKGQNSIDMAGTIYSPKGLVNLEGGSSGTGFAAIQIIAWRFDIGGNADLDMPYDPNGLYQFPEKGLVR
jgi:hypothetical protein